MGVKPNQIAIKYLEYFRGEIIHERNDEKSRQTCLKRLENNHRKIRRESFKAFVIGVTIQLVGFVALLLWIIFVDGSYADRKIAMFCTICIVLPACIWTHNHLRDNIKLLEKNDFSKWPFERIKKQQN